eukprot:Gregarina_sp_Pseudo_9__3250@NODE_3433_length_649_cov_145_478689_g3132_i0_p1_GENE_NODE_3433_length_649_cov_145_478689_g3132_i0NODE_3433_length_649_cov_145_478689_g3132_i0_p1_ORF_typecomplete_len126_score9_80DUF1358/PF07096_11/5e03DUF1358/PF07096_11/0_023DUF4059/PF13268_6/0_14_NODE_3433_length_649_cov_145_478689_g3132_i069446
MGRAVVIKSPGKTKAACTAMLLESTAVLSGVMRVTFGSDSTWPEESRSVVYRTESWVQEFLSEVMRLPGAIFRLALRALFIGLLLSVSITIFSLAWEFIRSHFIPSGWRQNHLTVSFGNRQWRFF